VVVQITNSFFSAAIGTDIVLSLVRCFDFEIPDAVTSSLAVSTEIIFMAFAMYLPAGLPRPVRLHEMKN